MGELYQIAQKIPYFKPSTDEIELIVEKYSFQNMKKIHNNKGKSFLRSGKSGDWKNYFSDEAKQLFSHYAGKELIALGYEKNNDWVTQKS